MADPEVNVTVEVQPPLDSSPPPTEASSPSTVVIAPQPSTDGSATIADLLERVRLLEQQSTATESLAKDAMETAISAEVTAMSEPVEPVAEMIVPESSDDGPEEKVEEKPAQKTMWWEGWI